MKTGGCKFLYVVVFLFPALMFFQGCSSSRRLSDYPDPGKFYERLNDKTNGRKVEVTTNTGGVLTAPNGIEAREDSVFLLSEKKSSVRAAIPLKLITRIDYKANDPENTSAFLYTAGGDKIEAYNIKTLPDTMIYDSIYTYSGKIAFATSEIHKIRYKSRLMALPAGIISGALAGLLVGALTNASKYSYPVVDFGGGGYAGKKSSSNLASSTIIGAFLGGMISLVIGFNYNFYFN